ncbi:MAG: porin family protein, partial [Kaistella sp.]
MRKTVFKTTLVTAICFAAFLNAQLFRTKDRMDNLEGFDNQKFSYGFFLAGNNYDYKMVLNPMFGMNGQKNLVQSKSSYSFGAGLIGKLR